MEQAPVVRMRRIHDGPADDDGTRVLVDRLWPRGVSKARAALDEWCRDVAPSDVLRRWYAHDPEKFEEFARRYCRELGEPRRDAALRHLALLASRGTLTLLTATKHIEISQAAVLVRLLGAGAVEAGVPSLRAPGPPASRSPRDRPGRSTRSGSGQGPSTGAGSSWSGQPSSLAPSTAACSVNR